MDTSQASESAGAERRRADRKPLRVDAVVHLRGQLRFVVRTLDISSGGLGIIASANPKPGTSFEIEFAVPARPKGAVAVRLPAQVVHSIFSAAEGGFKVGLRFTHLAPEAAKAIIAYMS